MKNVKEKKFIARVGATFNDEKAVEIGQYLESKKLDLKNYPAVYEDTLKNEDSPLRSLLEWNNEVAADSHRLQQVRMIVEHISIEVVYEDETIATFPRAFEFVTKYEDQPQELIGILEGLSEEDTRKQIVDRVYMNLKGWWETAKTIEEFTEFKSEFENLLSRLEKTFIERGYISS